MGIFNKIKDNAIRYYKMLTLWDIRSYLSRPYLIKISVALGLNVVNSIAKILAPASLAKAVEMIAMSKETEETGPFTLTPKQLLYISVLLTAWVKSEIYFKNFLVRGVESVVVEKNVMQLIKLTHHMPLHLHSEHQSQIIKVMMDIINLQSRLSTEVVTVISQTVLDIIIGTSLIWSRYGALIGGEFLLYSAIDIVLLTHMIEFFTAQSNHFAKMNKALQKFINREFEVMSFEETIRMLNHGSLETEFSEHHLLKYLTAMKSYKLSEDIASALKLIPFLIANIIPVSFIFKDDISIKDLDDFVFLLSYLNIFGSNILGLSQSIKSGRRAVISLEQMKTLLSEYPALTQHQAELLYIERPILDINSASPEIIFENVFFTYPDRQEPTLKNLNFRIVPGSKIGIIGHSNAGKSTLIKLLFGIYEVKSGSITINGHNIQQIPPDVLARIFCCVPQKIDLFRGKSLKYNVVYGSSNDAWIKSCLVKESDLIDEIAADYENVDFLNKVGEENFISTHQKVNRHFSKVMKKAKLETLITKSDDITVASSLSGGQKQRINIARALIRNSEIFVFDEVTNSLDEETKQKVLRNIWKVSKGKTTLMITHDLSTIQEVDEVIVLNNGEIIEHGSPREIFG